MQKKVELFWAVKIRKMANNPKLTAEMIVDEFLKFADREETKLTKRLREGDKDGRNRISGLE